MPPAKMAKSRLSVQVKALGEDGSFEGILAAYNNVDLGRDMIEPGAFTKTMQEHGSTVPLLWQHDPDEPIGNLELMDGPDALRVKGQLLMDLPNAKKAYLLLKAGIIKGMSIGYDTIKDAVDGKVRRLKELRLWEGSIVTFPMNEAAMVTAIKSMRESKADFNTELAEVQIQDSGYQIICALCSALYSIPWATGLSKEEKVAAAQTTIEQFTEAYIAYLPLYIDFLTEEYGDMELMSREEMEKKAGGKILAMSKALRAIAPLVKAGREFSAANMKTLKEAHDHVKSLDDIFEALFDDPADEEDDGTKSAPATAESKAATIIPEPVDDHSAAAEILTGLRSLIPKA